MGLISVEWRRLRGDLVGVYKNDVWHNLDNRAVEIRTRVLSEKSTGEPLGNFFTLGYLQRGYLQQNARGDDRGNYNV